MTTVINMKDAPKGWRNNSNYVYIGRGSKWGNPFHIKNSFFGRKQVVQLYKQYILKQKSLLGSLPEIKDKILVCFCKPLSCHGDVLVELANKE